uniref:Uncharacterized protein n=1 Tax=Anopheles epiroticus TaxID=199890 RepID=A0A182P840_9DIPT
MATISLKGSKTWPSILQRIDAKGRTYSFVVPTITTTTATPPPSTVPIATHVETVVPKPHRASTPPGGRPSGEVKEQPGGGGGGVTAPTTTSSTGTTTAPATANGSGAGGIANVTCNEHGGCLSGQAAAKASTLRRHYYPEGSWGWLVLAVGTLQAILNHGVQLSGPLYLLPAGERFHQPTVNSCGK